MTDAQALPAFVTDTQLIEAARLWCDGFNTQEIAWCLTPHDDDCEPLPGAHIVTEAEIYNRLGLIKEAAATLYEVSA